MATKARSTKKQASSGRTARSSSAKSSKSASISKKKTNTAFMMPMQASTALAKVVGSKPIPRTEVTKKLWIYIKKHDLQDKKNRRNINADDNLKAIFGGKKKVSMFEMPKHVSKNLTAAHR